MIVKIDYTEEDLIQLIKWDIAAKTGLETTDDKVKVTIEVKSKQNYKSEWEVAAFRANFTANL